MSSTVYDDITGFECFLKYKNVNFSKTKDHFYFKQKDSFIITGHDMANIVFWWSEPVNIVEPLNSGVTE